MPHILQAGALRTLAIAALFAGGGAVSASADFTVGYDNIFPIDSDKPDQGSIDPYVEFFTTTVEDLGGGELKFIFENASPVGTVGFVFIDDASELLSAPTLNVGNVGTVEFGSAGGNFPQGNKLTPPFDDDFKWKFEGGGANRIGQDEALGITFMANIDDVQGAFLLGNMRLGLHVQQITDDDFAGASDSIVSGDIIPGGGVIDPPAVPLPAPLALLGLGLASLFGVRRLRARA